MSQYKSRSWAALSTPNSSTEALRAIADDTHKIAWLLEQMVEFLEPVSRVVVFRLSEVNSQKTGPEKKEAPSERRLPDDVPF